MCHLPPPSSARLQLAGARMLQCSWKRHREGGGWLGGPPAGADDAGAPCRQLTLGGVLELPSLPEVLAAARPRGDGAPPPNSLLLFACRLEASALAGARPHLTLLTELAVGRCHWPDAEAGLGALLAMSPRLESLTLMDCPQGGSLPACVRARRGLHHLLLPGSGLSHLPPGPYLESEPAGQGGAWAGDVDWAAVGCAAAHAAQPCRRAFHPKNSAPAWLAYPLL